MFDLLKILFQWLLSLTNGNAAIAAENIALRHQLLILQRTVKQPPLNRWDRLLWVFLSKIWSQWRDALTIVKPETVISWHRTLFKKYWSRKSSSKKKGRPPLSQETKKLIRDMAMANPYWGAPRIPWTGPEHLSLLKMKVAEGNLIPNCD